MSSLPCVKTTYPWAMGCLPCNVGKGAPGPILRERILLFSPLPRRVLPAPAPRGAPGIFFQKIILPRVEGFAKLEIEELSQLGRFIIPVRARELHET